MSIETHSPSVADFRCEAVTIDTIVSPCTHTRLANIAHPTLAGVDRGADDPAVLIGLAFAFVRQGRLLDGHVPEPLMLRLNALADGDNAACRLLLDWLRSRNRDLGWSRNEHLIPPTPVTVAADINLPRRSSRERVLAASAKSGHHHGRKRSRTRPCNPGQNLETAIIAAETGERADG